MQKKEFCLFFLLNRTLYPNIKKHHKKARSISIILYSNHFLIKKPRRITPGLKNKTLKFRSCFRFIPRQIETHVEADWSPRYAVNSGLLTKIKGFKIDARQGLNMAGTYLLEMIILFLNKFKTASYSSSSFTSNRPSSNPDACCMASLKFFSINLAPLVIEAFIKRPCKRPISTKSSSVSLSLYSS